MRRLLIDDYNGEASWADFEGVPYVKCCGSMQASRYPLDWTWRASLLVIFCIFKNRAIAAPNH